MRHLEKSLLQALNDSKGRILDDDHVITTLETLKHEAAEVNRKVLETETIIAEVEKTSQQYTPFANYCASVYFALEQLNQIHFLYQYSLKFFLEIFASVLNNNPHLTGVTDYAKRLSIITDDMFQVAYNRVARGLLHEDRLTFAILLCRIYLKGMKDEPSYDDEFNQLLFIGKSIGASAQLGTVEPIANLSREQVENLTRLSMLPAFSNFRNLIGDSDKFSKWLTSRDPETNVAVIWEEKQPLSKIAKTLYALLVIHALRPDRLLAAGHMFVKAVLGDNFMSESEKVFDFGKLVETEVSSQTPVLLCSAPGYDASGRVSDLAVELSKGITPIAIGSAEGFSLAENAINAASKSGRWVLLKNVHLAPQWLVQLEKKLHSLNPHPNFRLFLTMEIHPKLPVNLLRAGRIIVYEPPPGIKANLLRTFSTVSAQKMSKVPAERGRLYFLLAWLHAIVQERLTYTPLGWSKRYEFSEADLRVAFDTFDTWIEVAALGRSNLPSDKVPWEALQVLLSQCIYGGRIDNDFDQKLLECFIKKLFVSNSFNLDFALTDSIDEEGRKIIMPEGVRREQYIEWVDSIQYLQSPSWLGLPNNAETVLLTTRGQTMVRKLLKLSDQDDELAYNPKATELTSTDRPQWMSQIRDVAEGWLKLFPLKLLTLKRSTENIKDPLYRFFERELNLASRFLAELRHDLEDLILICKGQKKQTNHHRMLFSHLNKGLVPENWRVYNVPSGTTVSLWINDFAQRIKQFEAVYGSFMADQSRALKKFYVWLGGLFTPEAYITATRQYVAQANAWSLEELVLEVQEAEDFSELKMDECSFGVTGLKIMGAKCSAGTKLVISDDIWSNLKAVQLRWIHVPGGDVKKPDAITLPVYLHSNRSCLLFTLDFKVDSCVSPSVFYEHGVAIFCNTTLE
ncbi:unnamed protein product [Soboliphyme baturini]|uniref:Dynein heavy chain region D6 P-loop domain-containing protein n=1 Tax=Soboliphyme baturini TaxID=241478 RepID=A0A3P8B9S4_9BILA|nr:unnamed protein product [Soboliphyme baturini]